ncbi:hypothetical protein COV13_02440 [Candidatus Woesearchaeota archaeon CG10_big_fil_rev_8_21_14_0_10_32_9]|nr:MAG: hypothetical protein COV13_02440 [Candidatus Woesearchaeota archaeon CG10_big_fil_rev_8_21_14_0_10_32_9]
MSKSINKKGESASAPEVPVELLLWIAGFLIILSVIYIIINSGSTAAQESVCRDSVIIKGKANLVINNIEVFSKATPLICEPIDKGNLDSDRETIKRQIADMAAQCWWMYAEGGITDLFDSTQNQKGCGVCYFFSIRDNLDEGQKNKTFFQEPARSPKFISSQELYNYMMGNNYNAKLLSGGGTINYVGDIYEFEHEIVLPPSVQEVRLSQIQYISGDYLEDFSGVISQETKNKVREIGNHLLEKDAGSLLVLVADKFDSLDKSRARRFIENIGLNTEKDKYDALLVLIDLDSSKIRIQMGADLEKYVNEYDLSNMMSQAFAGEIVSNEDLNNRIVELLKKIEDKLAGEYDYLAHLGIDSRSYYAYISNRGTTFSIVDHIVSEKKYVVAYMSSSSQTTWLDGILANPGSTAAATGVAALSAAIIYFTGGTTTKFVLAADVIAFGSSETLGDGLNAILGNVKTDRPNYILVTRASEVSSNCKVD